MSLLRYSDVTWSLPILFNDKESITYTLNNLCEDFHEKGKFINFGSIKCNWSGGRPSKFDNMDISEVESYLNSIVKLGVIPALTFSNYHLTEEDLKDEYCNQILEIAANLNCQFIISSDLLYNHIKSKYPEAYCTCSVIKPSFELPEFPGTEIEYYNKMLDKFDRIVIRPEYSKELFAKEYELISDISRVEIFLNQFCLPDCPHLLEHYTITEKIERNEDYERNFSCIRTHQTCFEKTETSLILSREMADFYVNEVGIKHIKIQGREYKKLPLLFMILSCVFEPISSAQFGIYSRLKVIT